MKEEYKRIIISPTTDTSDSDSEDRSALNKDDSGMTTTGYILSIVGVALSSVGLIWMFVTFRLEEGTLLYKMVLICSKDKAAKWARSLQTTARQDPVNTGSEDQTTIEGNDG